MNHLKLIINFKFLLVLIILLPVQAIAQTHQICYQCKKNITGEYLKVDGRTFHPEHFLCAKCNKVIEGGYQVKEGKYFHVDCYLLIEGLICDYCQKILDEKYNVSSGKKYHPECYQNFILPKCSICGMPMSDTFRVDNYGNKYHSSHRSELKQCDCCGRLICQTLTGGGRDCPDGRHICNLCFSTAVVDKQKVNELLKKVMYKLYLLGIKVDEKTVSINSVDRNILKTKSKSYSDNTHGFCDSQILTETLGGRVVKKTTSHKIYILAGMPQILTESTIAHELMHAWLNDNTKGEHTEQIREGSCNFVSYLYLKAINQPGASDFILLLENDPSPIYGRGFLDIRAKFDNKPVSEFLTYLKR